MGVGLLLQLLWREGSLGQGVPKQRIKSHLEFGCFISVLIPLPRVGKERGVGHTGLALMLLDSTSHQGFGQQGKVNFGLGSGTHPSCRENFRGGGPSPEE